MANELRDFYQFTVDREEAQLLIEIILLGISFASFKTFEERTTVLAMRRKVDEDLIREIEVFRRLAPKILAVSECYKKEAQ